MLRYISTYDRVQDVFLHRRIATVLYTVINSVIGVCGFKSRRLYEEDCSGGGTVDPADLKSSVQNWTCRFESGSEHTLVNNILDVKFNIVKYVILKHIGG